MKHTMTLDKAKERFREFPTPDTAIAYMRTAAEYWQDEMIGDATLNAAVDEVVAYFKARLNPN